MTPSAVVSPVAALIEDTYRQLLDGDIHISIIPRMTVSERDGKYFAYNGNRRLWVFKKLALEGVLRKVQVYVTNAPIPRKRFTTDTEGTSIDLRNRSDLDFPPRSPSRCARFLNKPTEQSFLGSSDAGWIRSLALSYEDSGYFLIKEPNGGWKYRGIPEELADLISEKSPADPTYVALGDEGRYFVKFEDGSMQWRACNAFTKAVRKGKAVNAVAFAPYGGWWISTSKGTRWDDLPTDLDETLQDSETSARFVSVSKSGDAWFVQFPEYNTWQGLDEGCQTIYVDEKGNRVSRITFGDDSSGCDDIVIEFY